MKYCVVKNTVTVIDGSDNSEEVMIQNAINAGFTESQVEILTKEEYETRLASQPIQPTLPTLEERISALEEAQLATMQL
jgi:tetrahydromethanopterin S-methyltransferase subunit H